MPDVYHADSPPGENHVLHRWVYANAAARLAASGFASSDVGKVALQTDNYSLWILTATTPAWSLLGAGGFGIVMDYTHIVDQKADTVNAGTFTTGAWQRRDLNTIKSDPGAHASVSGNQVTLGAGTYRVHISVPGSYCDGHQARLRDITNGATLLVGDRAYAGTGGSHVTTTCSTIFGRIVLSASTVLEVQHRCQTTRANDGFGEGTSAFGEVNIFTQVELWKE